MTTKQNLAVARRCGERARRNYQSRSGNPFPPTEAWASFRGAWYDGWDNIGEEDAARTTERR